MPEPPFQPPSEVDPTSLDPIQIDFWAFHIAHPEVYRELRSLAFRLRRKGFNHYSIKALYEVVRFRRVFISRALSDWQLNNSYTAMYSRLLMQNEPELRDFFRTRRRRAQPIQEPVVA